MYLEVLGKDTLSPQVIKDLFSRNEFELLDFEGVTPMDVQKIIGVDAAKHYTDWIYRNLK